MGRRCEWCRWSDVMIVEPSRTSCTLHGSDDDSRAKLPSSSRDQCDAGIPCLGRGTFPSRHPPSASLASAAALLGSAIKVSISRFGGFFHGSARGLWDWNWNWL